MDAPYSKIVCVVGVGWGEGASAHSVHGGRRGRRSNEMGVFSRPREVRHREDASVGWVSGPFGR